MLTNGLLYKKIKIEKFIFIRSYKKLISSK